MNRHVGASQAYLGRGENSWISHRFLKSNLFLCTFALSFDCYLDFAITVGVEIFTSTLNEVVEIFFMVFSIHLNYFYLA